MPKLPVEQTSRNSELMSKRNWQTGAIGQKIAEPARRYSVNLRSNHLKLLGVLVAVCVVLTALVAVVGLNSDFFKNFGKAGQAGNAKGFVYPVSVTDIEFPSEFLKQKFLDNFQKAASEKDENIRYKYLEENFTFLLGFYNSTHSYDFRVELEKFSDYMKKNYPKGSQVNKALYDFACVDKLCAGATEAKYPPEIEAIRQDLEGNKVIDTEVLGAVVRNFDAAAITASKASQTNIYMNVLSSLFSEYERTHDEGIKSIYLKLKQFLESLGAKIPEQILLE